MAGDEEKKKKKKVKKAAEKVEEPAPAPEPEPEPAPAKGEEELPPPSEEAPPPETDGEAPPAEAEAPPAEAEAEAAPPAGEGEAPAGEEAAEPPPAPKPKPKFFVHWNRRKARFYDYNFDYGENYYDSMVKYLDSRSSVPRRMAFAERGIRSSLVRKSLPDTRTASLLHEVKSSIKNFESSQKTYTQLRRKV